jgi:hypothetical protein
MERDSRSLSTLEIEIGSTAGNSMIDDEPQMEKSVLEELATVTKGLSQKKAMFLVFRSLVGVGILTMPHQINEIGIGGALVLYPIVAVMVLYALDLMVKTADDLQYYGQRYFFVKN